MSPKKKEHKKKKEEPPKPEPKKEEKKPEPKKEEKIPEPKKEEPKPAPKVVVVQKEEVVSEPAPKVVAKKNVTAPIKKAPPKEKADAIPDLPLPEEPLEPKECIVPVQEKPEVKECAPEPVKQEEPPVEYDPYLKKPTEQSVKNKFDDYVRRK